MIKTAYLTSRLVGSTVRVESNRSVRFSCYEGGRANPGANLFQDWMTGTIIFTALLREFLRTTSPILEGVVFSERIFNTK